MRTVAKNKTGLGFNPVFQRILQAHSLGVLSLSYRKKAGHMQADSNRAQRPANQNAPSIEIVSESLSEARFAKYLSKAGGNETLALKLYVHNARLSGAFLFPLGVMEVVLRNTVDRALVKKFDQTWYCNPQVAKKFRRGEKSNIQKALNRICHKSDQTRIRSDVNRDEVVAELTFGFWTNMFDKHYTRFWESELDNSFPNLKIETGWNDHDTLIYIRSQLHEINAFRNKVAHHGFVLDANIRTVHSRILSNIGQICPRTSKWVRYHSEVHKVDAMRPTARNR